MRMISPEKMHVLSSYEHRLLNVIDCFCQLQVDQLDKVKTELGLIMSSMRPVYYSLLRSTEANASPRHLAYSSAFEYLLTVVTVGQIMLEKR